MKTYSSKSCRYNVILFAERKVILSLDCIWSIQIKSIDVKELIYSCYFLFFFNLVTFMTLFVYMSFRGCNWLLSVIFVFCWLFCYNSGHLILRSPTAFCFCHASAFILTRPAWNLKVSTRQNIETLKHFCFWRRGSGASINVQFKPC